MSCSSGTCPICGPRPDRPEDFNSHDPARCQVCLRLDAYTNGQPLMPLQPIITPTPTGTLRASFATSLHVQGRGVDFSTNPDSFAAQMQVLSRTMSEVGELIVTAIIRLNTPPARPWYRHPLQWGRYWGRGVVFKMGMLAADGIDRLVTIWTEFKQVKRDLVRMVWLMLMPADERAQVLANEAALRAREAEVREAFARVSQQIPQWSRSSLSGTFVLDGSVRGVFEEFFSYPEQGYVDPETIPNPTAQDRARWAAEMDTYPSESDDSGGGYISPALYEHVGAPLDEKDDLPDLMDRITAELSGWQEEKGQ